MILGYLATLTGRLSFLNLLAEKIGFKTVWERWGRGSRERDRDRERQSEMQRQTKAGKGESLVNKQNKWERMKASLGEKGNGKRFGEWAVRWTDVKEKKGRVAKAKKRNVQKRKWGLDEAGAIPFPQVPSLMDAVWLLFHNTLPSLFS